MWQSYSTCFSLPLQRAGRGGFQTFQCTPQASPVRTHRLPDTHKCRRHCVFPAAAEILFVFNSLVIHRPPQPLTGSLLLLFPTPHSSPPPPPHRISFAPVSPSSQSPPPPPSTAHWISFPPVSYSSQFPPPPLLNRSSDRFSSCLLLLTVPSTPPPSPLISPPPPPTTPRGQWHWHLIWVVLASDWIWFPPPPPPKKRGGEGRKKYRIIRHASASNTF